MRAEVLIGPSFQHSGLYTMEKVNASPDALLQSLASGNMAVLDQLYDLYRNDFLRWAGQKFQVKNRDDLLDAWHDTMIMFYENVRDKKLTHLTCEVKTYLFTIGYRRLLKIYKKNDAESLACVLDYYDENRRALEACRRENYELGQTLLNWEKEQEKYIECVCDALQLKNQMAVNV